MGKRKWELKCMVCGKRKLIPFPHSLYPVLAIQDYASSILGWQKIRRGMLRCAACALADVKTDCRLRLIED